MKCVALRIAVKLSLAKLGAEKAELLLKLVAFPWPGALPTWTENPTSLLIFLDLVRPRLLCDPKREDGILGSPQILHVFSVLLRAEEGWTQMKSIFQ